MDLALAVPVVPTVVEVPAPPGWSTLVNLLIVAAIAVLPPLTLWAVKAIKAKLTALAEHTEKKLNEQTVLIAENTAVTKEVKHLVDGTRGMLLQRLADTLSSLARVSKDPEDVARAETAHKEASVHAEALLVAGGEEPKPTKDEPGRLP